MLTPCSMLIQTWSPGARPSVALHAPLEEPLPRAWLPWSWRASFPMPLVCSGDGFLLAATMPEAGRYTHKKDDGICNSVGSEVKYEATCEAVKPIIKSSILCIVILGRV